jgi:hypothetical protein
VPVLEGMRKAGVPNGDRDPPPRPLAAIRNVRFTTIPAVSCAQTAVIRRQLCERVEPTLSTHSWSVSARQAFAKNSLPVVPFSTGTAAERLVTNP